MTSLDPAPVNGSLKVGRVAAPLREQAAAVLREAILDFRLKPGQRLVERELIEQTGVSRATIREVLRQLTAEGLVTIIPQRGAVVVDLTPKEAADLYEVRATLEAMVARLFAERASDAEIAELRQAVEDLRESIASSGSDDLPIHELIAAKDRYYDVYLRGCGNAEIRSILEGLQARVRMMRATSLGQPGRPQRTLAEIETVVQAIERRDGPAAAAAAEEHVRAAAANGLRGLENAHDALSHGSTVTPLR